jgi:nucleotide-binding universal stress UspA family protein
VNILLPVDGSACSERMLAYLSEHKDLLPGDHRLIAFTVIDPAVRRTSVQVDCVSLEQFLREVAEPLFEGVLRVAKQRGWRVDTDYVPGAPVAAIVAKAEACKPDMILMGTRARSPVGALLLGSVASGVLAACKVPVLLIR